MGLNALLICVCLSVYILANSVLFLFFVCFVFLNVKSVPEEINALDVVRYTLDECLVLC